MSTVRSIRGARSYSQYPAPCTYLVTQDRVTAASWTTSDGARGMPQGLRWALHALLEPCRRNHPACPAQTGRPPDRHPASVSSTNEPRSPERVRWPPGGSSHAVRRTSLPPLDIVATYVWGELVVCHQRQCAHKRYPIRSFEWWMSDLPGGTVTVGCFPIDVMPGRTGSAAVRAVDRDRPQLDRGEPA
jgi:hypothetical protein